MSAECCQTALESTADRIEFPFTVVFVKFSNNNSCFDGEVLSQIITDQFLVCIFVHDSDICIGNLAEVLSSCLCLIDRYCKSNSLNI